MPAGEVKAPALADDLRLIREAAAGGAAIAMGYFRKSPEVYWKGSSPVTEADYAVDTYLKETLTAARPDYGWLSEETADSPDRLGRRRVFVVDPIDGTRAFMDDKDTWCVSIAVIEAGRPMVGVLDCPAMKEIFVALRGEGATRNGSRLEVRVNPSGPVIAGPKSMIGKLPASLRQAAGMHPYVPSLAYRIAMVADGRIDATFVKENSQDWDLAAADLILSEAGGAVLSDGGDPVVYGGAVTKHGMLAAGSGQLLRTMVSALGTTLGD